MPGFRDKYLYETIKVLDEDFIQKLETLNDEELFKTLQKLSRSRTKGCKLYYAFWIFKNKFISYRCMGKKSYGRRIL